VGCPLFVFVSLGVGFPGPPPAPVTCVLFPLPIVGSCWLCLRFGDGCRVRCLSLFGLCAASVYSLFLFFLGVFLLFCSFCLFFQSVLVVPCPCLRCRACCTLLCWRLVPHFVSSARIGLAFYCVGLGIGLFAFLFFYFFFSFGCFPFPSLRLFGCLVFFLFSVFFVFSRGCFFLIFVRRLFFSSFLLGGFRCVSGFFLLSLFWFVR